MGASMDPNDRGKRVPKEEKDISEDDKKLIQVDRRASDRAKEDSGDRPKQKAYLPKSSNQKLKGKGCCKRVF